MPTPSLGESRSTALWRFNLNKRSLLKKGTWDQFEIAVEEYLALDQVEEVPPEEVEALVKSCFYKCNRLQNEMPYIRGILFTLLSLEGVETSCRRSPGRVS